MTLVSVSTRHSDLYFLVEYYRSRRRDLPFFIFFSLLLFLPINMTFWKEVAFGDFFYYSFFFFHLIFIIPENLTLKKIYDKNTNYKDFKDYLLKKSCLKMKGSTFHITTFMFCPSDAVFGLPFCCFAYVSWKIKAFIVVK